MSEERPPGGRALTGLTRAGSRLLTILIDLLDFRRGAEPWTDLRRGANHADASASAGDDVTYTDDNLGEAITETDQNQVTHGFGRDVLGRTITPTPAD